MTEAITMGLVWFIKGSPSQSYVGRIDDTLAGRERGDRKHCM
ncbi:hypothetical protein ACFLX5_04790 [Chloroflexota bacterium]